MKSIVILGASGSIGTQALEVLRTLKKEYKIVGISVGNNIEIIDSFCKKSAEIKYFCVKNFTDYMVLIKKYPDKTFFFGDEGLIKLLNKSNPDVVLNALSGFAGFMPTIETINMGKVLLLANKESLVAGGEIVNEKLKTSKTRIIPIDSEHVAIAKCLYEEQISEVARLYITASGGPFFDLPIEKFKDIKPSDALNHPTWSMGQKITIDSASMMNKCFEIIEAYYLFNIPFSKITPVVDRKSFVHSYVKFKDGRVKLQVGKPDMRGPIAYALNFGEPLNGDYDFDDVEVNTLRKYHIKEMDYEKFPNLKFAKLVLEKRGNYGAILNAADEVCVNAFLNGDINFIDITKIIDKIFITYPYVEKPTLNDIVRTDREVRILTEKMIENEDYE